MIKQLLLAIHEYSRRNLFLMLLVINSVSVAGELPFQIDPLDVSPESFELLLENEFVRVLQYRLLPGEKDKWHTHPAKVSYVLSAGRLRIHPENGDSFEVDEALNAASWSGALGKHYAENIGNSVVRILLVEPKTAPGESRGAGK